MFFFYRRKNQAPSCENETFWEERKGEIEMEPLSNMQLMVALVRFLLHWEGIVGFCSEDFILNRLRLLQCQK